MTWGEFKKHVEDKGVTDQDVIESIDVDYETLEEYDPEVVKIEGRIVIE